jgi:origin recognition complex subunit 2
MTFHAFYTRCREEFLATSETTLKSHLTEFIDHELTRTKKGSEGIVIPFADEVIAQLLEQIKD